MVGALFGARDRFVCTMVEEVIPPERLFKQS